MVVSLWELLRLIVCVCVCGAGVAIREEWAGGIEKERQIIIEACVYWWVWLERLKIKYQVYLQFLVVRSGVDAVSSVRSFSGMCSGSSRLRLGVNDTTVLQVVGMVLSAGLEQRVTVCGCETGVQAGG